MATADHAQLANLAAMARSIFHQVGATEVAQPELTTLVSFNGTNGAEPVAGLIADAHGDLFGTTTNGGANNDGTVFEITGSGFSTEVIPPTTTIILGNDDNLSVNVDNSIGYTVIIGNGDNDTVSANNSSFDTIILGNGDNDIVSANNSRHDTITLGNGANVAPGSSYD